jgi:hypothetical protein
MRLISKRRLIKSPTGIKGSKVSISCTTAAFSPLKFAEGLRGEVVAGVSAAFERFKGSFVILPLGFAFLEGLAGVALEGPAPPPGVSTAVARNSVLVHFSMSDFLKKYLFASPAYVQLVN